MAARYYYSPESDITFVDGFDAYEPDPPGWRGNCYLITVSTGILFGRPPASLVRTGKQAIFPLPWMETHRQYWENLVQQFRPKTRKIVELAGLKVFAKLSGLPEEKLKVALHENKTCNKER